MFNENRSCIEIKSFEEFPSLKQKFNENRSCIEINELVGKFSNGKTFNENRSCIEIRGQSHFRTGGLCLMKTEVVLKSS